MRFLLAVRPLWQDLASRSVQANEIRRAICWRLPISELARAGRGPFVLVDIGCSAGLNLVADRLPAPAPVPALPQQRRMKRVDRASATGHSSVATSALERCLVAARTATGRIAALSRIPCRDRRERMAFRSSDRQRVRMGYVASRLPPLPVRDGLLSRDQRWLAR